VLAAFIALVSALTVWVKRQALDTNNWTNSSAQLLENDKVRGALSVYLVDQLYQNVNVGAELQTQLPPQLKGVAAPLAGALRQLLVRTADALLARPRVQELWKQANRRAHKRFIDLLDGHKSALESTNGNVVLNLEPLIEQLTQQGGFVGKLATRIPPDAGQIVILKSNQLETARKAIKVLRFLSYFLVFLVLALYALAVYLARGRRQILMGVGVSAFVVGLLVLVVRRLAGNYFIDALTTNAVNKDAVSVVWAIETNLLRNVGINILIYASVVIFAAWIAGPSRPATWVRRVSAPTMRDNPWVVFGLVALVLLIILWTGPTDSQRIYPLLVLFALAFVGTEVLRRQTLREFPTNTTTP
ncbi:MAG: hypothetical protein ACTHNB_14925, partial [Gaiellaceae bacterium]